ncbi:MAG: hypothetical protein PHU75_03755 [Candidatus Nanopelagicales bacterium]|nr:hypothetical protein [Candidatus Nanopelagicales bacterium]
MSDALWVARKLAEYNLVAHEIWGDRYEVEIVPWREAVREVAAKAGCCIADAALRTMKAARNEAQFVMLGAAAVDLMREADE